MRKLVAAASLAAIAAAAAPAAAHGGAASQPQVRAQVAIAGILTARDTKRFKPPAVRRGRAAAVRGYYSE